MSELTPARPLERTRRPRVQISYEVNVGGATERVELPFVVGVLAELSGRPAGPLPPLRERRFVEITRDNFDAVLAAYRPGLVLSVPDMLGEGTDPLDVTLGFGSLADFAPDAVAAQVEPLRALLEARSTAEDPAAVDRRLSAQLHAIFRHPDFERLEAAWRGLHYLVANTETGPDLHIRVLSCTRQELLDDQRRAPEYDQSVLFEKVHEEPYRTPCGTPFGLLVGDFEFSAAEDDVSLLRRIAAVAAHAHAPFVAAASPRMFGLDRFTELVNLGDLSVVFDRVEYRSWRGFRQSMSMDSCYVALTLPRVLARLPYGTESTQVGRFDFQEAGGDKNHDEYLWMSAAWAYAVRVTDAFAKYGWLAATRGVANGGKVEGLPVHTFLTEAGEPVTKGPTEVAFNDLREYELSTLGFMPLQSLKDHGFAIFMAARSCNKPLVYSGPGASESALMMSKINLLLSVSRFAHHLKLLAREQFGEGEIVDCASRLNNWLSGYVLTDPENAAPEVRATKPLREARLEIRERHGHQGRYEIVWFLLPYFEAEGPAWMRQVAEVLRDTAFRPAPIDRAWLRWNGGTVAEMARTIRDGRRFGELPVLADALEDAGCADERILGHCRERSARHGRGCWVLDALLADV